MRAAGNTSVQQVGLEYRSPGVWDISGLQVAEIPHMLHIISGTYGSRNGRSAFKYGTNYIRGRRAEKPTCNCRINSPRRSRHVNTA